MRREGGLRCGWARPAALRRSESQADAPIDHSPIEWRPGVNGPPAIGRGCRAKQVMSPGEFRRHLPRGLPHGGSDRRQASRRARAPGAGAGASGSRTVTESLCPLRARMSAGCSTSCPTARRRPGYRTLNVMVENQPRNWAGRQARLWMVNLSTTRLMTPAADGLSGLSFLETDVERSSWPTSTSRTPRSHRPARAASTTGPPPGGRSAGRSEPTTTCSLPVPSDPLRRRVDLIGAHYRVGGEEGDDQRVRVNRRHRAMAEPEDDSLIEGTAPASSPASPARLRGRAQATTAAQVHCPANRSARRRPGRRCALGRRRHGLSLAWSARGLSRRSSAGEERPASTMLVKLPGRDRLLSSFFSSSTTLVHSRVRSRPSDEGPSRLR